MYVQRRTDMEGSLEKCWCASAKCVFCSVCSTCSFVHWTCSARHSVLSAEKLPVNMSVKISADKTYKSKWSNIVMTWSSSPRSICHTPGECERSFVNWKEVGMHRVLDCRLSDRNHAILFQFKFKSRILRFAIVRATSWFRFYICTIALQARHGCCFWWWWWMIEWLNVH